MYMSAWHETISSLISREGSSNLSSSDDASRVKEFSETLILHGVLQHFWQGHYSRVLYLAEKSSPTSGEWGNLTSCPLLFCSTDSFLLTILPQYFRHKPIEGHHDHILCRNLVLSLGCKVQG